MENTPKYVARIVSAYFMFLLATTIFIHATFMQLYSTPVSSPSLDINIELAMQTRSVVLPSVIEEQVGIIIDHHDITGLKRIVRSKRKRDARKIQRATEGFSPAALVASISISYEAIFDSLNASETRSNIISEAKKHLGLRYIWGGTTPKGFDCSGFTSYVLAQKGVGIARSSRYQARQGEVVDIANAKTGDLVFFSKYGKGGRVTHVAMVVDNKKDGVYVIHATNRGIVVDNLTESSYWKPKMLYAKDVIGRG
jgi:cell wall-associated NlpC family hydrolase